MRSALSNLQISLATILRVWRDQIDEGRHHNGVCDPSDLGGSSSDFLAQQGELSLGWDHWVTQHVSGRRASICMEKQRLERKDRALAAHERLRWDSGVEGNEDANSKALEHQEF